MPWPRRLPLRRRHRCHGDRPRRDALGAGRDRVEDTIDPAVGVRLRVFGRDQVEAGQPIVELHYNDSARLFEAVALATDACTVTNMAIQVPPRIFAEVRLARRAGAATHTRNGTER